VAGAGAWWRFPAEAGEIVRMIAAAVAAARRRRFGFIVV
jgi:hypothetical protein